MWLLLGGISVAGVVAWMKIGAPFARMLELHDDMSAANRRVPQVSSRVEAQRQVDSIVTTGDLRNLAKSIGPAKAIPAVAAEAQPAMSEAHQESASHIQA